jgi:hypothetical protein
MNHLKLYEDISEYNLKNFNVDNFIKHKYWRYKSVNEDSIIIYLYTKTIKNGTYYACKKIKLWFKYHFPGSNGKPGDSDIKLYTITNLYEDFKDSNIYDMKMFKKYPSIYDNNEPIFRPATKDEINKSEILLQTKKFNL